MLAVKLTSPGPVFYRQARSGRFGRLFNITKLRTMCANAEQGGPVWSTENDPRVTPVSRFLRKYRIDELPQLFHVLMGDMSFVGPRPERPEIIEKLAKAIPYYQERLMVQPGISGWAQVNYPYGASVEDAWRKLEYDLYYMKNMGVFLDIFILLDTVRIVLCGGVNSSHSRTPERRKAMADFQLSTAGPEAPAPGRARDVEWTAA
jgi:lipopolysaccharide/colanic/teichoic acid biosynthesis glycosyltransferase